MLFGASFNHVIYAEDSFTHRCYRSGGVVADGVQSTDVWELLDMLGSDIAQGYSIRRPLDSAQLTEWLRSNSWLEQRWVTPLQSMN
jgi:hypothetical protein